MTGRRALVTGSSGGIGREIVRRLAGAGYRVVGLDRAEPNGRDDAASFVVADLGRMVLDEAYADQTLQSLRRALGGPLGLLVNNAAVQILGPMEQLSRTDLKTTLDVNLIAPLLLSQAFLAELEREKGSIVNISSIHARLTKPEFVAYATSKAALSGLTRAMAVDLKGRVRVNAIEPAAIETDMLKAGFADDPQGLARLGELHPLGRIGWPSEVAALVMALDGGPMQFLHGACVPLDGGIGNALLDPSAISSA